MTEKVTLKGANELARALKKLGPFAMQAMAPAVRKAAKLTAEAAAAKAPRDTGELAESIVFRKVKSDVPGAVRYIVGPKKGRKTSSIAFIVEFGVPAAVAGGRVPGAVIPPRRAQPFMRPAFDETKRKAVQVIGDETFKGVKRQVKRINTGKAKVRR